MSVYRRVFQGTHALPAEVSRVSNNWVTNRQTGRQKERQKYGENVSTRQTDSITDKTTDKWKDVPVCRPTWPSYDLSCAYGKWKGKLQLKTSINELTHQSIKIHICKFISNNVQYVNSYFLETVTKALTRSVCKPYNISFWNLTVIQNLTSHECSYTEKIKRGV